MDSAKRPTSGDSAERKSIKDKIFGIFGSLFNRPAGPAFYDPNAQTVEIKDYVTERLEPFTKNFYNKANRLMGAYFVFQVIIIVASAVIPIVNVLGKPSVELQIVSASLGGVIVVCTGFLQLTKSSERGIILRILTAQLQNVYHNYMTD